MPGKYNQRSINFRKEVDEALHFWWKETGIPINHMVNEGCLLKIKELENIYKKNHKERG